MTLVNAHTHLEFSTRSRLLPEPSAQFSKWIVGVAKDNDTVPKEDYPRACALGVAELVEAGTSEVGDFSKTGCSLPFLIEYGLTGIIWIQVLGERLEKGQRKLSEAKEIIEHCRKIAANTSIKIGLGIHSPYSLNPQLWEPALRYCESEALSLCIHVAESPSERELFIKGTGTHRELEKALDLPPFPCPHMSPVVYLHKMGALQFSPFLVHTVQVDDDDILLIKNSNSKIVHCPRSNDRLQCGRMPLEKFVENNIDVFIGTDSRASSPSLDVREELEFAKNIHRGLVESAIIDSMVIKNLYS